MLIEQTLFGEVDKVHEAIKLLRKHEPPEGYYLCFSGGKDSVTVYHLAKLANVKFNAHYNLMYVEPPELLTFIKDAYPDVSIEIPPLSMAQLIVKKKIPPLRFARYCTAELKQRGGEHRLKLTGIRSQESHRRAYRPQLEPDKRDNFFLHPIKSWLSSDVWQFIHEHNVPYCKLYDEGYSRIGCVLCPFQAFAETQRDLERFPTIADYYKQACIESFDVNREHFRNSKGISHTWNSGIDMFNWWISSRKRSHYEPVGSLFKEVF